MDQAANLEEQKSFEDAAAAAAAVQAQVTQAFTSMGGAMLALAQEQKTIAETLNQVIADRNQQLDLVGRLVEQIQALTKLQDSDHAAIEVLMATQGNGMGPRHVC